MISLTNRLADHIAALKLRKGVKPVRNWIKHARLNGPKASVWQEKVIFVHIPKAAGSSVARLDVGYTIGHQTYGFYEKWCPAGQQMPPTFAVVRNPYDRYISAYNYLADGRGNPFDTAWALRNSLHRYDLNSFATTALATPKVQEWMHFMPQVDYVLNAEGTVAVDHILHMETIADDWPAFATQFDLPPEIPMVNVAKKAKASPLNAAAKAVIADLYADDFKTFDYAP